MWFQLNKNEEKTNLVKECANLERERGYSIKETK